MKLSQIIEQARRFVGPPSSIVDHTMIYITSITVNYPQVKCYIIEDIPLHHRPNYYEELDCHNSECLCDKNRAGCDLSHIQKTQYVFFNRDFKHGEVMYQIPLRFDEDNFEVDPFLDVEYTIHKPKDLRPPPNHWRHPDTIIEYLEDVDGNKLPLTIEMRDKLRLYNIIDLSDVLGLAEKYKKLNNIDGELISITTNASLTNIESIPHVLYDQKARILIELQKTDSKSIHKSPKLYIDKQPEYFRLTIGKISTELNSSFST